MAITFYGDPHGCYAPLLKEWERRDPSDVILIGDMDLERPLTDELEPLFRRGTAVWWIYGNHDCDNETWYRNLTESHPEGNLGNRVQSMCGLRVAGLGGVYRGRIWYPDGKEPPRFETREAYLATLPKSHRWRGGLPMRQRATIFPEDHELLGRQRADILVCHEAPSTHETGGFPVIDDLARKMGIRLIVHGHHHRGYEAELEGGIKVQGLAIAEPFTVETL